MTDVRRQCRNHRCNGVDGQSCHDACTPYIEVRVVFTPLGHGRHRVGRYPHEEFFRLDRSQSLHQFVGNPVHIDKRHIQLARHVAGRLQVSTVSINQLVTLG